MKRVSRQYIKENFFCKKNNHFVVFLFAVNQKEKKFFFKKAALLLIQKRPALYFGAFLQCFIYNSSLFLTKSRVTPLPITDSTKLSKEPSSSAEPTLTYQAVSVP